MKERRIDPCRDCLYTCSKDYRTDCCPACDYGRMLRAKEDGRLMESPVRIGQKVYVVLQRCGGVTHIEPGTVREIRFSGRSGKRDVYVRVHCDRDDGLYLLGDFSIDLMGEKWFLSMEGAEKSAGRGSDG